MNLTGPSALIIIDVIDTKVGSMNKLSNKLASYVYNTPEIKMIIVHTSGEPGLEPGQLEHIKSVNFKGVPLLKERPLWNVANRVYLSSGNNELIDEWEFMNDYKIYFRNWWSTDLEKNARFQRLRDNKNMPFVRPNRIKTFGTHSKILNMKLRDDQTLVGCWSMLQLKYLVESYYSGEQSIDNFIYAGGALDVCLKDRTIGYEQVGSMIQSGYFSTPKNIVANSNLIFDVHGVITKDKNYTVDKWECVAPNMFKLIL